MAQGGLLAACLVLVTTLTILYQGSRVGPAKNEQPAVIGQSSMNPNIKLASTGK
jgi:hypothetical protein